MVEDPSGQRPAGEVEAAATVFSDKEAKSDVAQP